MPRSKEPRGLGAEYERLVTGSEQLTRREERAIILRAASVWYRVVSWLASLVLTFVIFFATFALAEALLPHRFQGWAVLPAFVVLVVLIAVWRGSHAPLVRLLPRHEYARFRQWQSQQQEAPKRETVPPPPKEETVPASPPEQTPPPAPPARRLPFPPQGSILARPPAPAPVAPEPPVAPAPVAPIVAAPNARDEASRLELLRQLHDRGLIDADEYAAKRAAILEQI